MPVALSGGALAGLALFAAIEKRLPPCPRPGPLAVRTWVAKHAVLALWAGVEEIAWRALLLGELAPFLGDLTALVAASVGFGLWHRSGKRLHVLTGFAFGSAFLAGGLVAAWAAHATYNAAVALANDGARGHQEAAA